MTKSTFLYLPKPTSSALAVFAAAGWPPGIRRCRGRRGSARRARSTMQAGGASSAPASAWGGRTPADLWRRSSALSAKVATRTLAPTTSCSTRSPRRVRRRCRRYGGRERGDDHAPRRRRVQWDRFVRTAAARDSLARTPGPGLSRRDGRRAVPRASPTLTPTRTWLNGRGGVARGAQPQSARPLAKVDWARASQCPERRGPLGFAHYQRNTGGLSRSGGCRPMPVAHRPARRSAAGGTTDEPAAQGDRSARAPRQPVVTAARTSRASRSDARGGGRPLVASHRAARRPRHTWRFTQPAARGTAAAAGELCRQTVLDVGAWDATTLRADAAGASSAGANRPLLLERRRIGTRAATWPIACSVRRSRRGTSTHDRSPEAVGTFDVVLFWALYHLPNPFGARPCRRGDADLLVLETMTDLTFLRQPTLTFQRRRAAPPSTPLAPRSDGRFVPNGRGHRCWKYRVRARGTRYPPAGGGATCIWPTQCCRVPREELPRGVPRGSARRETLAPVAVFRYRRSASSNVGI